MSIYSYILLFIALIPLYSRAEETTSIIIKDIKSFGAKGDGKTNDQEAFEKAAAFFNNRGGNGKLIISKGVYIIGRQIPGNNENGKSFYTGVDVLHFTNVKNLTIAGKKGAKLKYKEALKYGSFDPTTGKTYNHTQNYFVNPKYAAFIGHCIYFENSTDIKVSGLEIDGSNQSLILGGHYGDVGRQLPHYGMFIKNCRDVQIGNMNVHHLALDGISIANSFKDQKNDGVEILDSKFEYNGRQGLSWIGGNGLKVLRCSFNHTGMAVVTSPPGAGLDIEAEVGPISNGFFEECEFINNAGCGLVADSGKSSNCTFSKCTFWGVSFWSIWVNKPGFTFKQCNIYGSFVHGFDAPDTTSATKFISCNFEDKSYEGKQAYGGFLVESNGKRRISFENCSFTVNSKKLCWVAQSVTYSPEEKYQFNNCTFVVKNANYKERDFVALIRGIRYKNCTFEFKHPEAKSKGYWLNDCCEKYNVDLGGNQIIYSSYPSK